MKKLFKIFALSLLALPLCSCNFDINPADVMDNFYDKRKIYIEEDSVVIKEGEKRFVSVEADNLGKGADVEDLTFTSCDNVIATAKYGIYETEEEDFEGMFITGKTQGSTSIIASYKNATASCEVKVIKDTEVPYLHLFNENITIEVGSEYVVNSEIIYKDNRYTPLDDVIYTFAFIENEPEIVELYQDDETGNIVVNPQEVGSTKVLVTASFMDKTASSLLEINVVDQGVGIIIKNDGFEHNVGNDYTTKLYVSNYRDYSKTIDLDIELYRGDVKINDKIVLTSDDTSIATVTGYHVEGVSRGQTTIRGIFEDIELTINVFVDKPVVYIPLLEQNVEIDVSPRLTLSDPSLFSGDIIGVYYQDMSSEYNLYKDYSDGVFTLDDAKMRTLVKDFGEHKKFLIETEDIYVDTGFIDVYSKIIRTYDDLCSVKTISQKYVTERFNFNGYFVLENNITCPNEGTPVFFNRTSNFKINGIGECIDTNIGFNGVFDGKGHTLFNYKPTGYGSFITWLTKEGVLKNLGFENATLDSSLIDSSINPVAVLVCNGQGSVSNVYVNYKNISTGLGKYENKYCSTFCSAGGSIKASSIFINGINATINGDFDILGKISNADGVYALGGTHINGGIDFGSDPVVDSRIFSCTGIYRHFTSASQMKEHLQTQSTIANWNKNYWTDLDSGIPSWKTAK